MPWDGSGSIGFWGTVRTMTGTPARAACSWPMSAGPLTRPWSSASTITTSGRSWAIWAATFEPSDITSSSLICCWEFRRLRIY